MTDQTTDDIARIEAEYRTTQKLIARLWRGTTPVAEIRRLSHDLDIARANELQAIGDAAD